MSWLNQNSNFIPMAWLGFPKFRLEMSKTYNQNQEVLKKLCSITTTVLVNWCMQDVAEDGQKKKIQPFSHLVPFRVLYHFTLNFAFFGDFFWYVATHQNVSFWPFSACHDFHHFQLRNEVWKSCLHPILDYIKIVYQVKDLDLQPRWGWDIGLLRKNKN